MTTGVNFPDEPQGSAIAGAAGGAWPYTSQRLAEQLVALGILPAATVSDLIAHATSRRASLVDAALERGVMTAEALRDAMSRIFEIPVVDVDEIDEAALAGFPRGLAQLHTVLPVERHGDRLVLAVPDPTRSRTMREIRAAVDLPLELRLATADDVRAYVHRKLAPRLSAKLPDGTKVDFIIPPSGAKIGRADTNDIILRDPSVSSMHAILQPVEGGGFQIVDFGSRNGVYVNRRRIRAPRPLAQKDKITIGKVQLKYKLPDVGGGGEKRTNIFGYPTEPRLRAAWIAFWGRIIAQTLGALALIFLGLAIGGGLPTSCSPFGGQSAGDVPGAAPQRPAN